MDSQSISLVEVVAKGLGALRKEVVFVGGATTSFYIKDRGVKSIRLTDDVDCIIEIIGRLDYYKTCEKLRTIGFKEISQNAAPLCRWNFAGIIVDVMPTDPKILGFSNKWYKEGILEAEKIKLPSKTEIAILSLPYFIGTKLEAFKGRGKGDYLASADIEDIVTVIDGNEDFAKMVSASPIKIRKYLKKEFQNFLSDEKFLYAIEGHISDRNITSERAKIIQKRIQAVLE